MNIRRTQRFYKILMKKFINTNNKLKNIKDTNKEEYIILKKELDYISEQILEYEEYYILSIF
jgi:hypothetical protein